MNAQEKQEVRQQLRRQERAVAAARAAGLQIYWALTNTAQVDEFLAICWEDGGYCVSADGAPLADANGNSVRRYEISEIDSSDAEHLALIVEWYWGQ